MWPSRSTTWYGSFPWAARAPACSTTTPSGWMWRGAFPSDRQMTSRVSGTMVAPKRTIRKAATLTTCQRRGVPGWRRGEDVASEPPPAPTSGIGPSGAVRARRRRTVANRHEACRHHIGADGHAAPHAVERDPPDDRGHTGEHCRTGVEERVPPFRGQGPEGLDGALDPGRPRGPPGRPGGSCGAPVPPQTVAYHDRGYHRGSGPNRRRREAISSPWADDRVSRNRPSALRTQVPTAVPTTEQRRRAGRIRAPPSSWPRWCRPS